MPGLAQTISGSVGKIRIRELGVDVGKMAKWTLRLMKVGDTTLKVWKLEASFTYFNEVLFADPDYEKDVRITIDRSTGKQYRLVQVEGHSAPEYSGGRLLWEGLELCPVE